MYGGMSLIELIAGVEAHEKTLTVFNADAHVTASLREHFSDRNVVVTDARTADGPQSYAVLSQGDEFITAARIDSVLGQADDHTLGFEEEPSRPILDYLDETTFTSYDTGQMIAASQEIEDRAWRMGTGAIHAGFQRLSILETRLDIYEQLASRDDLSVHVYAAPDVSVPDHEGFTVHVERSDEIRRAWFVAYDGAGMDANKCALLAEEREPRTFYGFWTYDPATVDWITTHLSTSYGIIESDGAGP